MDLTQFPSDFLRALRKLAAAEIRNFTSADTPFIRLIADINEELTRRGRK